ncbi:MAG: N-acetyltransferase [Bacteroidales bacterium]|nr:N-acetyltransferase [Bacteroidales bacterium]
MEDFFHNDAIPYAKERLGKTYCFVNNDKPQTEIVAFFTVSNDSVKTTFIPKSSTNKVQRKVPGQKHLRTYPAVLLGRLGVAESYKGKEFFVGQQIMNYLKSWFIDDDNKTGCRFLVVDAYNRKDVLDFYERNKFKYLYLDEEEERREQFVAEGEERLHTRLMFLDLMHTEIIDYPF